MGFIRDAAKNLDDQNAKKELETQLEGLSALASAKADYFELQLTEDLANAGAGTSKHIPVKFIIDFTRQTHAYSEKSADSIASTVTDAIDGFITGGRENVMNGVKSLLTKAIQVLFTSTEGGEEEKRFTSVFAEGRSLVRLDLKAWKRFTKVKSVTEQVEQISAFVMCKSTIDAVALDYNTFINLYQKNLYNDDADLNPKEIAKQLEEMKNIYDQFLANQKASETTSSRGLEDTIKYIRPSKKQLFKAIDDVATAEKNVLKTELDY